MGRIAYLRNKTIFAKSYIILIKREKTFFHFRELIGPYLLNLKFPSPKDDLCLVWPSGCGEEYFVYIFSLFLYHLPLDSFEQTGDQKSSLELLAKLIFDSASG